MKTAVDEILALEILMNTEADDVKADIYFAEVIRKRQEFLKKYKIAAWVWLAMQQINVKGRSLEN